MKNSKIDYHSIQLTQAEMEEAILEGKVKKHFKEKANKNGIKWDTEHEHFGREVNNDYPTKNKIR